MTAMKILKGTCIVTLVILSCELFAQDVSIESVFDRFELTYTERGSTIFIKDNRTTIDEVSSYVAPVITTIELLGAAGVNFDEVQYVASAPNVFVYSLRGMKWAPDIQTESDAVFIQIQEPTVSQNPVRFAWLAPEQGGEERFKWAIPHQKAKRLPAPYGYEWRSGDIDEIPMTFSWYVPKAWEDGAPRNFSWEPNELYYRLVFEKDFVDYYFEFGAFGKAKEVSELIVDSILSQSIASGSELDP